MRLARATPAFIVINCSFVICRRHPLPEIARVFRFGGKYAATAFWEMFNVFNVDNWLRYQGSLQSSTFGLPLTEGPKRRQQLGFRFDF